MNRKKLAALIMVLALAFTTLVGGTLAYFTDEDDATNVFTMGNVKIEQMEDQRTEYDKAEVNEDTGLYVFQQNQKIYPAVHKKLVKSPIKVGDYTFNIRSLEGNYIDKIISVKNTGNSDAYVRTIIAIPNMNGYDDSVDASENPFHWNYLDASDFNGTGWDWNGSKDAEVSAQTDKIAAVKIDGIEYDIYVATYNAALEPKDLTSPSMVGFYLDDSVGYDDEGYFSVQKGERIDLSKWLVPDNNGVATLKIYALSQACQTEGFDDAWEALDEAFGDVNATNAAKWFAEILA